MKKVNFNKGWSFSLNGAESTVIDLPHDFSVYRKRSADSPSGAAGGYFQGGYGEYTKSFTAKKGKKYFFMCDGSFGITELYVNASLAYINKYAYNSFYADISDFIRYDRENVIKITVNNNNLPNARWYTGAGVYRDAFLCECDGAYLDPFGPFVYTESILNGTAYLGSEIRFFSEQKGEGVLDFEIFEDSKKAPVTTFKKYIFAEEGENTVRARFQIDDPKIWDIDTPSMYSVKVKLSLNGKTDTDTAVFGIRTLHADSKRGLLLNGKAIKLRGGCVHHDHGPLGACAYPDAEYRRVARLKAAGFNSVRCSHNPQSQHFYDACDRLGMLVIDELFDYWTQGKQTNDFHAFFEDNYEKWTELIVRRNRCHPSIIMWSTGNEIPQKTGRGYGYRIARNIADKIRSMDTSRPLTHAFCSLWDNDEEYKAELSTNSAPASEMDYWAQKTSITADTVDIAGYNYLEPRIDKDILRFPKRLIVNTETFPIYAYTTIKQLLGNPRIVGDYVWTAWDYFGETGIGHVDYHTQGEGFRLTEHPYHIANCGDIDICGNRKPQSYYREISWGLREKPYIAVRTPKNFGIEYFPSAWGFYECEPSWCWQGYEGKPIEVYVFGDCDQMLLEINGTEVSRLDRTENGVYYFKTVYEAGNITAKAVVNGRVAASSSLETEGAPDKICLTPEKRYIPRGAKKPDTELVFVDVEIRDANGSICTRDDRLVAYEAQGASIVATCSANLTDEELYNSASRRVNGGKSLVILKKDNGAEKITLSAYSDTLSAKITF